MFIPSVRKKTIGREKKKRLSS